MVNFTYKVKSIFFLHLCLLLVHPSCHAQNSSPMEKKKTEDASSADERKIITAPIVLKSFIKKNGEPADFKEMYVQRSIKDYFIKFCESQVTRKELEDHLAAIGSPIKTVTLEVSFREGEWDVCEENELMQSRIGEYVIVHRIVKKEMRKK